MTSRPKTSIAATLPTLNSWYRGLYNFYYGTQASGPVISRIQNPEAFFNWYIANHEPFKGFELQVGFGHESNGMFVDSRGQYDTLMLGMSHRPDGTLPMNPQDFSSMGWNYWKLMIKRGFAIPGNLGIVSLGLGIKYHINQDFSSMYTFANSRIEDSSLYLASDPSPSIQQFDGILTQARYFKTFRRYSPISYAVKSLALEYSGRMGYHDPYNHSGHLQIEGDVTLLKLVYEGLASIPWVGWVFYPLNGFSANIPLFARWTFGYSENLAYYPAPYASGGKVSFGFVINRDLTHNQ